VLIVQDLSLEEETELLSLEKNTDVFAWTTSDMIGVSRSIIEHKLYVNPSTKPKKAKALQNIRRKNCSGKGGGATVAGCMFHQRG
jgi:hypothetical protein